jgi:homogentisate 1,2-dioxygenase
MIDYQRRGVLPQKHHIQLRRPGGEGVYYEECFTREGFEDAYSILYHAFPITDDVALAPSNHGWAAPVEALPEDGTLRRRLFQSTALPTGGTMLDARAAVLFNSDLTVLFARPTQSDAVYFSNGDGDELAFVFEGSGRLESAFGWLPFRAGDYVWIPRGAIHRWHLDGEKNHVMFFECHNGLRVPKQFRNPAGQLRMDAPYSHRDFVRPEGFAWTPDQGAAGTHTVVFKRRDRFTERVMEHHPLDVVGWDGAVYPVAFAIEKYQPKTGLVHLPPTIHGTFASDGLLVCSFVPRVVDFHPEAIPCPYPHTSVDCDEIILYVRGNFTSRRGVGPGALSLHPAGVPHGPHPGAYERSIGTHRTDELAVMVDTYKPLKMTANALAVETREYHDTWHRPSSG